MILDGKIILLTGGTGSFGQKFTEVVLREHRPKGIRVFSRGELLQHEMAERFRDPRLKFFIGDVRDRERLYRAMHGADIVVHAAALKQVPGCEYNPFEAVKTNIMGTANVIDAAIDNGIERAMFISTDKAVNPVNLYGATKLCAEKLFIQANSYAGGEAPYLSCVRYGNVLGSRGSVVHVFREQRKTGALSITDERMTRFWITIEQGVQFALQCLEEMRGGEVFIPKIPSMKVVDLARAIAPEVQINVIGVRPGEKIHEVLISEEEARRTKESENFFLIEPDFRFWRQDIQLEGGSPVPKGFVYASNTNTVWLTEEQMREIMKGLHKEF